MKEKLVVATSKDIEVGRNTILIAETLAEAVEIAGSEARVLELFNRQHATNETNALRKPSTGGVALKTTVQLYHKMVENGVSVDQALNITKLTAADIAKVG